MASPRTASPREVLVSGAGVAGASLAYWLARHGMRPTVVERAQGLRSSGNPVDVRGPGIPVVTDMGITRQLREAATAAVAMRLVDGSGRKIARVRTAAAQGRRDEVEVPRSDLAAILYEAARSHAEFLFDDSITAIRQPAGHRRGATSPGATSPGGTSRADISPGGVEVEFDRAAPRRFDLVIGADGLHSNVRRLAFGPEHAHVHHLGLYVATLALGRPAAQPDEIVLFNTPGRLASIHPARGSALAAFIFRGPAVPDLDYRDTARHRQLVLDAYAGVGWEVPQLLEELRATDEFYFDAVSAVRLPTWTTGRVTLAGDAASCVSLLGDGSSLAIAAARTLAESLATHADPADALRAYEANHRRLVAPKQRTMALGAAALVPKTGPGIAGRNLAARLMQFAFRQ